MHSFDQIRNGNHEGHREPRRRIVISSYQNFVTFVVEYVAYSPAESLEIL